MATNKPQFSFICTLLLLIYTVNGYSQTAPSVGHVCQDGCHACFKNEYNELIKLQLSSDICSGSRIPRNGDTVCLYGYNIKTKLYLVNEKITTADGCNTCTCTEHGAQCTKTTCNNKPFAKPSTQPLYGNCNDQQRWYKLGALWEADDGCNTCTCIGVGNYQGPFICTQGICNNKPSGIVG